MYAAFFSCPCTQWTGRVVYRGHVRALPRNAAVKDVRGLKKTKSILHITCDNQWYKISIKDWLEKPGILLYLYPPPHVLAP
jgi:hypothetical protein